MSKIMTASDAVGLINDGDVIAASGFILAAAAETLFKRLGERYEQTQHPKDLTLVFAASAGCGGKGGMGHDHLCKDGMIAKVIGGHFGLAPELGKYIAQNKCKAYNFPLGVMAAIYRAAVQNRKGELSKVGLGTFCDPRVEGGKL